MSKVTAVIKIKPLKISNTNKNIEINENVIQLKSIGKKYANISDICIEKSQEFIFVNFILTLLTSVVIYVLTYGPSGSGKTYTAGINDKGSILQKKPV